MHGILILDKPVGPTCQKILSRFRRLFPKVKVGYTGTLDPFATGVLPIFFGGATKFIPFIQESKKIYSAHLKLGEATDTLDSEGVVIETAKIPDLSQEKITETLQPFLGVHDQTPPAYSAVKIDGVPLYRYARQGIAMEAAPRKVEIFSIEGRAERGNEGLLSFTTEVSRGTYIRVLASDIAKRLGSVGHLVSLRRLKSGDFKIEDALGWEEVEALSKDPKAFGQVLQRQLQKILTAFTCLNLPNPFYVQKLIQGQKIPVSEFSEDAVLRLEKAQNEEARMIVTHENQLVAMVESERDVSGSLFLKPTRGLGFEV